MAGLMGRMLQLGAAGVMERARAQRAVEEAAARQDDVVEELSEKLMSKQKLAPKIEVRDAASAVEC